ncbi:MAG: hypothetical protein ACPGD5_04930 [Salibacteraceae bacterium]
MIKNVLVTFCLIPFLSFSQNQEIATFVSYNLLNYRNETSFCTNSNNSPIAKEGYFETIFSHVKPDLIACNELGANPTNAVKILDRCLNVNGETKFEMASFSSSSGSNLANAFFYNGDMFAMHSSDKIINDVGGSPIVRLIDVFKLYYKDANLQSGADTTFLTVFVGHLKAGNTSSDRAKRASATEAIMNYIDVNNVSGNYIFSGDFNVYSDSEMAFQQLINPANLDHRFVDPINRLGSWNNNSSFAEVHTQSTHSTSNGCASGGGLDDRFDFILMSADMKNNTDHMEYVNNSYQALANDGNHFNSSINNPANTSVPANVLNAIYNGSDHLPVVMDVIITEATPNNVVAATNFNTVIKFVSPSNNVIRGRIIKGQGLLNIKVYDITGKLLKETRLNGASGDFFTIPVNASGLLFIDVQDEFGFRNIYKVIQN